MQPTTIQQNLSPRLTRGLQLSSGGPRCLWRPSGANWKCLYKHGRLEEGDCEALGHRDVWQQLPVEPGGVHAQEAAGGDWERQGHHQVLIYYYLYCIRNKDFTYIYLVSFVLNTFILASGHVFSRQLYISTDIKQHKIQYKLSIQAPCVTALILSECTNSSYQAARTALSRTAPNIINLDLLHVT